MLLDLGNCLIHTNDNPTFTWLVDRHAIAAELAEKFFEGNPCYLPFCRGEIDEINYHQYLVKVLQPMIPADNQLSIQQLRTAYSQSILSHDIYMLELVEELAKSLDIIIVTDTNTWQSEEFRQRIDFDSLATCVFESHLVGMLKQDPNYWPHVLGELGIKGAQAILIDDNVINRRMAAKSGIHTPECHFNPGKLGVQFIREQLSALMLEA